MSILKEVQNIFREALKPMCEDPEPFLKMICRTKDSKFGDYQANFAMSLGKQLDRPPLDIANEIINRINNLNR